MNWLWKVKKKRDRREREFLWRMEGGSSIAGWKMGRKNWKKKLIWRILEQNFWDKRSGWGRGDKGKDEEQKQERT